MTREEKAKIIDELSAKFAEYPNFYIADNSGMTVAQVNKLRKLCYAKGIEYKVVKNTLIAKALQKNNFDYSPMASALKGNSGILFSTVANAPAKLIKEFHTGGVQKPTVKGAAIGTEFYVGATALDTLVNLKSKEEMVGEIIGLLQSPARRIISALLHAKEKEGAN